MEKTVNRKQVERDVAIAYHVGDRAKVKTILEDLTMQRNKLDRWFDKYLDMFDAKMDRAKRDDPVWKLYFQKFNVYCDLKQSIKTTEYFLGKM